MTADASPGTGQPADIVVFSAGAVEHIVTELAEIFSRETGHRVSFTFGTAGATRNRVKAGDPADVVIASVPVIESLEAEGLMIPGSRIDLGRTVTGIVIRAGAPVPDISSLDAFRQTLLAARSVAYTDPKSGGSSGIYFVGLLERLGIAEAVGRKAVLRGGGRKVSEAVANGEAELGTTFISEILPVPGAKVAGPLPKAIQNSMTYAAALPLKGRAPEAAQAFIASLTDPATRTHWSAAGLDPMFGTEQADLRLAGPRGAA